MNIIRRKTNLLVCACLVTATVQAQETCNWDKASVHFYPHLLEVKAIDNEIKVVRLIKGQQHYETPRLELSLTGQLPPGVTQDFIRWQADWDGRTLAVDYASEVIQLGNSIAVDLSLKPVQFTPENNYTLLLKPRAFLGSAQEQACAKEPVVVVLRTGDVRDGLIRSSFVQPQQSDGVNSERKSIRLWAMVGQSVANRQVFDGSGLWVGLPPPLTGSQSSQGNTP